jgi:hypothetical protein
VILDAAQVAEELAALGLSDNLVKLTQGRPLEVHPSLRFQCQRPRLVFEIDITPHGRKLTPLWEKGETTYAFWDRDGRREFIKFDAEVPEEFEVLGYRMNSVVVDVLVWLRTENDVPVKEIIEVGMLLGFHDVGSFVEELERVRMKGFPERRRWEKEYRLALG